MAEEREFKGVWIPKEIWLDERLNMLEKGILTEIDSLDNESGCSAGNEYLAKFCQCSETKVSTAIKKLIDMGLIYQKSFNGRIRILKSRLSNFERQSLNNLNADFKNVKGTNINNNKNNNYKIFIDESVIFDYWNSKEIIKHDKIDNHKKAILNALKENSIKEIKTFIDRYAEVVKDKNWYFNTKWTLTEFLKQKNAMNDFKDDGSKWLNYISWKKQNKTQYAHDYTEDELNSLFTNLDEINI